MYCATGLNSVHVTLIISHFVAEVLLCSSETEWCVLSYSDGLNFSTLPPKGLSELNRKHMSHMTGAEDTEHSYSLHEYMTNTAETGLN